MLDYKFTIMEENQFMILGLRVAGYNFPNRCKIETNIKRFHSHFGLHPLTCEKIWADLKETPNANGCINANTKPVFLLIGLRFLWKYESEEILATFFSMSAKTVRKYYKESAEKIHLLLDEILQPIKEIDDEYGFVLSIDGTHCPKQEQKNLGQKKVKP